MRKKELFLFLIIIICAFILRIFKLSNQPEGFEQSEAAFGYNAYSIVSTGKDEYGRFLPLVLESFGDYKLALFSYWLIPFITVFGLNEFSVRLGVAIAGILGIIIFYFLIKEIFGQKKLALLTSHIVAISPWYLVFSRFATEAMLALIFFYLSIFIFYKWYQNNKIYYYFFSILFLMLSVLTYYSAWIPTLFILGIYGYFIFKKITPKLFLILKLSMLLLPIVSILTIFFFTTGKRLHQINSIENSNVYPLLQEQIMEDQQMFPLTITRVFHNKIVYYPLFTLRSFFNTLTFDFLFLQGDKIDKRFTVPYNGVLYLWLAPFILVGIIFFWKYFSFRKNFALFGLIIAIFLSSALSVLGSESQRTLFAVPLFCILGSQGLIILYNKLYNYRFFWLGSFLVLMIIIYQVANFNHQYYWHANVHQPWGRNFGEKEMIETIHNLSRNYKNVFIAGDPYIYFYFYDKVDPKDAQLDSQQLLSEVNYIGNRLRSKIENYFFMPVDCPAAGKLKTLYVCKGNKIPKNSNIVKIILYRDGRPSYIFLEFIPEASLKNPPRNLDYMAKYGVIPDRENINWLREDQL